MKITNGAVQPYDAIMMIGRFCEQGLSISEIESLGFTSEEMENAMKFLNIDQKDDACELDLA